MLPDVECAFLCGAERRRAGADAAGHHLFPQVMDLRLKTAVLCTHTRQETTNIVLVFFYSNFGLSIDLISVVGSLFETISFLRSFMHMCVCVCVTCHSDAAVILRKLHKWDSSGDMSGCGNSKYKLICIKTKSTQLIEVVTSDRQPIRTRASDLALGFNSLLFLMQQKPFRF